MPSSACTTTTGAQAHQRTAATATFKTRITFGPVSMIKTGYGGAGERQGLELLAVWCPRRSARAPNRNQMARYCKLRAFSSYLYKRIIKEQADRVFRRRCL